MARVLFAKGVRGEIVRRLQRRLLERGFDPNGVDGDYGEGTEKATAAFQRRTGLPQTGEVDPTTWKSLVGGPVPSVRDRALQLTAAFEGHDFTLAQGNYDGAGVTWASSASRSQTAPWEASSLEVQGKQPELVETNVRRTHRRSCSPDSAELEGAATRVRRFDQSWSEQSAARRALALRVPALR